MFVLLVLAVSLGWFAYGEWSRERKAAGEDRAKTRAAAQMPQATPGTASAPRIVVGGAPASPATAAPLPPPGTSLVQIYVELKRRAAEGSAPAACRVAFELERCKRLPALRKAPDFWKRSIDDRKDMRDHRELEWHVANAQSALAVAESACRDFPEAELANTWDYVLAAAIAGNRHATWRVSSFPPGLDADNPENTLEGWAQWRAHVAAIVEQGIRAGDARVFSMASRHYQLPFMGYRIFPPDRVRALALQMALLGGVSDGYRRVVERDIAYLVEKLQITPTEKEEAARIARSLPPLTGLPAGGFDWSRGMQPTTTGKECEEP